jgi:molecular chaperone GrpE
MTSPQDKVVEEGVPAEAPSESPDARTTADGLASPDEDRVSQPDAEEPDWRDLALRKAAELENVRKQTTQRVQKATRDGMRRVALELLPALDDFERALAAAEAQEGDADHHLTKGIRLVQQQLVAALHRAGIEAYSPRGDAFDPHLHEAVATSPVEGAASGTVVEVYQAGYRLGDDVLRAAKVVVAA